jgi:hypothetical protein
MENKKEPQMQNDQDNLQPKKPDESAGFHFE